MDEKPDKKIHILKIQESLIASVIEQQQENRREISTTDYLMPKLRARIVQLVNRLKG